AGDVFDAGLRGFSTAVPVLRLAVAVGVAFVRFVFFPAITPPLDHLPHRRRHRLASHAAMVKPGRAATQRGPDLGGRFVALRRLAVILDVLVVELPPARRVVLGVFNTIPDGVRADAGA